MEIIASIIIIVVVSNLINIKNQEKINELKLELKTIKNKLEECKESYKIKTKELYNRIKILNRKIK